MKLTSFAYIYIYMQKQADIPFLKKKFFPTLSVCRSVESRLTESIKTKKQKTRHKTAAKNIKTMKSACTQRARLRCAWAKMFAALTPKAKLGLAYLTAHSVPLTPLALRLPPPIDNQINT